MFERSIIGLNIDLEMFCSFIAAKLAVFDLDYVLILDLPLSLLQFCSFVVIDLSTVGFVIY